MSDLFCDIDLSGAVEKNLSFMARTSWDFALRFWDDEDKTQPSDLTGSRFDMTVVNKAGDVIIAFSTEDDPGGFTIENGQDLVMDVEPDETDKPEGIYQYVLQQTLNGKTWPELYGTVRIKFNSNPLPTAP